MTDKTDTALADKVRQFRSNAPKLDIASLARAKQVAGETLFHTGAGGKTLAPETEAKAILGPSPAPDATHYVTQKAETISAIEMPDKTISEAWSHQCSTASVPASRI